eukprot:CAMPEP_0176449656 /NCGR_PEP_ID=MMETSP0127-20121128/26621_1 /TAXON_ID=938130 /ORGANISM="Platyophrya macrostoma, Strain WH" /LENGTH=336 /DNA_ID=CAMNT_0017837063 /DNA_START=78 /DNA_END=1085 /DNA_ORIENTATION=+
MMLRCLGSRWSVGFETSSSSCAAVTRLQFNCLRHHSSDASRTREAVLKRWNTAGGASPTSSESHKPQAAVSRALAFATRKGSASTPSASSSRVIVHPTTNFDDGSQTTADEVVLVTDVKWVACERMDFHVQYHLPEVWAARESARENYLVVQCSPAFSQTPGIETETLAPIHGISLNCFAYHRKVNPEATDDKLLDMFLKRFSACTSDSVDVLQRSRSSSCAAVTAGSSSSTEGTTLPPAETHSNGSSADESTPVGGSSTPLNHAADLCWVDRASQRVGGAICELAFTPLPLTTSAGRSAQKARGYCRAFYNKGRRFHYVMMAVVPEDEFFASQDL